MTQFVALFRGINVGGANALGMERLRDFLDHLGFSQVRTYIQSGNAVFRASGSEPRAIRKQIASSFPDVFGFAPKVIVLRASDLADAIRDNPFAEFAAEPDKLHVGFLSDHPAPHAVAALSQRQRASESWGIEGYFLYLHTPDGIGRSAFAASIEPTLGVSITFRNWRTVLAVAELAGVGPVQEGSDR